MKEKRIVFIITLLLLMSCKGQSQNKEQNKFNNMFETFDFDKFEKENEKWKDPEHSDIYLFERGKKIMASWKEIFEIPPYPSLYLIYKEFYEHPNSLSTIKEKGKYIGDLKLGSNAGVKIGKWYYFDEKGKIIEEIDEDRKFGKFDYSEVIKFLDKQKDVNIMTGEGRDKLSIVFYNSDKSNIKLWKVIVNIGKPYGVANLPGDKGMRYAQNAKSYYLDGDTGEIVKGKQLLNYKTIIPNFNNEFPMLIK